MTSHHDREVRAAAEAPAAAAPAPPEPSPQHPHPTGPSLYRRRAVGLLVILGTLAAVCIPALALGSNPIPFGEAWDGLVAKDSSQASLIVWTVRIPRLLLAVLAGAAFGVAGALVQALTRNPLADPGILGVNAGAGFAVVLGVAFFGVSGVAQYVWFAFIGAALTTVGVYLIGSAGRNSASPVTLVLAGVALAAVLGGITSLLSLLDPDTFRAIRNWGLGSVAMATNAETFALLPFIAAGLLLALVLSGSLNSIALGDDLAASLGTNVTRTRVLGIIAVTLLAGAATALTGGIAFVGLMVPHIVRWFVGPDQRWIMAYSALAAPVLVIVADVLGRVAGGSGEIQVGLVTPIIGAPVLIALVRRRKASGL